MSAVDAPAAPIGEAADRPVASHLRSSDLLRAGSLGLRTRRLRAALSGLGIAIGIAAMVAVLGISASSRADLLAQLDALGTNLLEVTPGQTLTGDDATLPTTAAEMIERVGSVEAVTAVGSVDGTVRRTDHIDEEDTNGIGIRTGDESLLDALSGEVAWGRWHDAASTRQRTVVLGSVAAERLGIGEDVGPGTVRVRLGDEWFTVIGVLEKLPLAPELDRAAIIGTAAAEEEFGYDGAPSTVYVRTDPDAVEAVRGVLGRTANPTAPEEVTVSRPSDALAARAATDSAFTALLVGLGGVALLVGGVGIANVMVVAVLERRSEIGLRRALGATRRHIAGQFIVEALLLSAIGGIGGLMLGSIATAGYASGRGWTIVIPAIGLLGGFAAALVTGAVAGSWPAIRAARMSPTDALRTT